MTIIFRLGLMLGLTTTLAACGAGAPGARLSGSAGSPPLMAHPPAPPAISPQESAPAFRIQDARTYFHQHPLPLRVLSQNWRSWYDLTTPEQFANLSGYVYSSLNISINGWWWIPPASSFKGFVYRWEPGRNRWQIFRSHSGEAPVWVAEQ